MSTPVGLEYCNSFEFHTFCGFPETECSHWNTLDPQQDMPTFIVFSVLFDCDRDLLLLDEHLFPDSDTIQQRLHSKRLSLLFDWNHRYMAFFLHHGHQSLQVSLR